MHFCSMFTPLGRIMGVLRKFSWSPHSAHSGVNKTYMCVYYLYKAVNDVHVYSFSDNVD